MVEIVGLQNHQVIQRDTPTTGLLALSGSSDGPVEVRVVDPSGRPATGWEAAGAGGPWKVDLTVPVGGPYDVVAREGAATPTVLARGVLVGDLWLLAGQSNMQGVGLLGPDVELPSPKVALLDMTRTWRPAVDPLHRLYASPDLAHNGTDDTEMRAALVEADAGSPFGAGLGVPFANAMVAAAGVPIGLVATAHGGTSLTQWSPELRHEGGGSLFGSMLLSLEAAGGRIAGALWYQGESDALELQSEGFTARLQGLVAALRTELGQPDLPFFHVQLGRVVALPGVPAEGEMHWNAVREAQRLVDLGPGGLVTAVDLALSDFIHISTLGLQRLGRRLAQVASRRAGTIAVRAVEAIVTRPSEGEIPEVFEVRVELANATAPLSPREHIAGFSVRGADGTAKPFLYATTVDPTEPTTVVLNGIGTLEDGDALWYGYGLDPYCNLVDADDMAVPAFGPIQLTRRRATG
jgi:sialate O-acetylesterase